MSALHADGARLSIGIAVALALALAAGIWIWRSQQQAAAAPSYVTEPVTRGNLSIAVTANGTLQPTRSVNIGSELSGTVTRVLVDVNDRVRRGQVLVELDTAKFGDQVARRVPRWHRPRRKSRRPWPP